MWWWAISHLYCFCDYWSIAVNSMDKLQFLTCIIIYHQAQTTLWRVTQNKSYDVLLVKFRPCDGWVQPHCRSAIWICTCDHIRWNLFWGVRTHGGVERCPFPIFLTFSTASVMTVWWWRWRTIYNLPISFPRRYSNSTDSTVIMVHATSSSSSQPVAMTFHLRTHRVCAVRIRSVTFHKKVRHRTHDCNTTVSF